MRLSAELLGSSEQRTNALGEREIVLRGLAIPAIEHLAVTRDAFDTIDFTDNRLTSLDNFPRLSRLSNLLLSNNVIELIDSSNLAKNVPNLTYLDLGYNQIASLSQLSNLGKACTKLQFLNLTSNPVTSKFFTPSTSFLLGLQRQFPSILAHSLVASAVIVVVVLCLVVLFAHIYILLDLIPIFSTCDFAFTTLAA